MQYFLLDQIFLVDSQLFSFGPIDVENSIWALVGILRPELPNRGMSGTSVTIGDVWFIANHH